MNECSKDSQPAAPNILNSTDEQTDENGVVWRNFTKAIEIKDATYIRNDTNLMSLKDFEIQITWITISMANVKMRGINFRGLLQVTAKGSIEAENCTFSPIDVNNKEFASECTVEVFAQSSSKFTNCKFHKALKAALLVRDRSNAEVTNCHFNTNVHSSLLVLDSSTSKIQGCCFQGENKFAVYVYRKSFASFENCRFNNMKGKAVFVLFEGHTTFNNCTFTNCAGGAISIAESSSTDVNECHFKTINFSAVHGIKNCRLAVHNSTFMNCLGNGVNFEHSNGFVKDCIFEDFRFPVFAVFGPNAKPLLSDCTIKDVHSFGAVSRDCAIPIFERLKFIGGESHCFSVSDFSRIIVRNCIIQDFAGSAFCIYNGSWIFAEFNKISNCQQLAKLFYNSYSYFRQNLIQKCPEIWVKFKASYDFESNGLLDENDLKDFLLPPNYQKGPDASEAATDKQYKELGVTDNKIIEKSHTIPIDEGISPDFEPIDVDALKEEEGFVQINEPKCTCLKCNKAPANVYFTPCGHCVLCKECAKDEKFCPLCSTTIQKSIDGILQDDCIICYDPADTILLPCGHINICYSCAMHLWGEGRKCPECREKIVSFRHIFAANE